MNHFFKAAVFVRNKVEIACKMNETDDRDLKLAEHCHLAKHFGNGCGGRCYIQLAFERYKI